MFRSRRRSIVFPQSEHLRLVGTLAMLWGNPDFDCPPVEQTSMIMGMGLHDRGYGLLDNAPIGGMGDEEWNEIARRGFYMQYSDVVADTIAKYHVHRLAQHYDTPERKAMAAEFSNVIDEQISQHGLSRELFDRLDRITNLCDNISFSFCFEMAASGQVSVFPRNAAEAEVSIRYHVEDGIISAAPWPFSVDAHEGYLLAYRSQGYPEQLDPLIVPFRLQRE